MKKALLIRTVSVPSDTSEMPEPWSLNATCSSPCAKVCRWTQKNRRAYVCALHMHYTGIDRRLHKQPNRHHLSMYICQTLDQMLVNVVFMYIQILIVYWQSICKAHTYTHIHSGTHAHTCIYIYIYTHTHTHIHTYTHTHTRTHAHTQTHAHIHVYRPVLRVTTSSVSLNEYLQ